MMDENRNMSSATIEEVAASVGRVQAMSRAAKEELCDDIFRRQPNLLGHVLVLSRLHVPMEKVDRVLHILLVLDDLFTRTTPGGLPQVSLDELEAVDANQWAMLKLMDSEDPDEARRVCQLAAKSHPEVNAFAFALCHLIESGVSDMLKKEDEFCVRAVRNLVDAFARARAGSTRINER
ncbi:MAG: hypothetical protein K8T26_19785 [Lentisphaerae bacterium]|nr:hypothetical protein [Lentisphaerota bacterium]